MSKHLYSNKTIRCLQSSETGICYIEDSRQFIAQTLFLKLCGNSYFFIVCISQSQI